MQVFGAGSSAWYTDECQAVERSVRIGVLPGMTERPRVQIPPGPPRWVFESVKDFFYSDIPRGGREIVSRKRKDSKKESLSLCEISGVRKPFQKSSFVSRGATTFEIFYRGV